MSSSGSVTHWIAALKEGDPEAAQRLWERYYTRLVALARQKLQPAQRRHADEEDVVQNAFHSFFQGVSRGRFPQLDDRDNLWRLLAILTARKALDQVQHERCQKRGGGMIRTESRMTSAQTEDEETVLQQVMGAEPTPEFAAQVVEQYRLLLDRLGDDSLRHVAIRKMEGCTTDEIAAELACSRRTVARKLDTIRTIWQEESDS